MALSSCIFCRPSNQYTADTFPMQNFTFLIRTLFDLRMNASSSHGSRPRRPPTVFCHHQVHLSRVGNICKHRSSLVPKTLRYSMLLRDRHILADLLWSTKSIWFFLRYHDLKYCSHVFYPSRKKLCDYALCTITALSSFLSVTNEIKSGRTCWYKKSLEKSAVADFQGFRNLEETMETLIAMETWSL